MARCVLRRQRSRRWRLYTAARAALLLPDEVSPCVAHSGSHDPLPQPFELAIAAALSASRPERNADAEHTETAGISDALEALDALALRATSELAGAATGSYRQAFPEVLKLQVVSEMVRTIRSLIDTDA